MIQACVHVPHIYACAEFEEQWVSNHFWTLEHPHSCCSCKGEAGVNSDVCCNCPVNSSSPPGSTALSDCHCNQKLGYTGPNSGPCSSCGVEKYKNSTGSVICITCPAFSNAPTGSCALSSCVCKTGYSGPNAGPCTPCAAATYTSSVGTSSDTCTLCLEGMYSTATASTCNICLANTNAEAGNSFCLCNKGYTGPSGGPCTACLSGTYSLNLIRTVKTAP